MYDNSTNMGTTPTTPTTTTPAITTPRITTPAIPTTPTTPTISQSNPLIGMKSNYNLGNTSLPINDLYSEYPTRLTTPLMPKF